MAPVSSGGRSLRTRCTEDKRPLGQLSNKIRGSRAAKEYVDGTLSAAEAQSKYLVTAETFSYWKYTVENSEYPALLEAERAAQQAREVAATPQSRKKEPPLDKADEFEKYCEAYIHAGQRAAQVGKRKAADEATRKFGITISASTAFRASKQPGQRPEKPGRQLLLGEDLERKLEDPPCAPTLQRQRDRRLAAMTRIKAGRVPRSGSLPSTPPHCGTCQKASRAMRCTT